MKQPNTIFDDSKNTESQISDPQEQENLQNTNVEPKEVNPELMANKNMPVQKDEEAEIGVGNKEAVKEVAKEVRKNTQKLDELIHQSGQVLFRCKTLFPFDFFPDEITIDIQAVNIYRRNFFKSGRTQSIYIQNIAEVYADRSLFFSQLHIVDKHFVDNIIVIKFMKKKEADIARQIIQGLVTGIANEVDFTKIPNKEILPKLIELGKLTALNK